MQGTRLRIFGFHSRGRPAAGIGGPLRLAACLFLLMGTAGSARAAGGLKHAKAAKLVKHYALLPLAFEPNRGQADPSVKFLAHSGNSTIFFNAAHIFFMLWSGSPHLPRTSPPLAVSRLRHHTAANPAEMIRLGLMGANGSSRSEASGPLPGNSNYFIGDDPAKWIRDVPTYTRVTFQQVYPGIDIAYYGNRRELEFDFIVSPQASPGAIRLKITGSPGPAQLSVGPDGCLEVRTSVGEVRFHKPRVYQAERLPHSAVKRFIPSNYMIGRDGIVGLKIGTYDHSKPLVIDPVLSFSTYLGGTDFNYGTGIAVDGSGDVYLTGYTTSTDFPVVGGVEGRFSGGSCDTEVNTSSCFDAFIAKLNPQGSGLLYSTYLGGTGDDRGIRIAVDSSGAAYVAGYTDSLDFPTAGAFQNSLGGGTCGTTAYPDPCFDAFVAKLSASGSSLIYSSYLGGTGDDFASAIAVDSNGNAFVGGLTSASNFPTTTGALQTSYGGGPFDGFVAEINAQGTAEVYSTYLGGSGEDHVASLALDSSDNVYVTGQTNSPNFPTHAGFDSSYKGATCGSALSSTACFEAFVSKLNPTGTALIYSSYLGGSAASYGNGIALDSSLNAYVAGWTTSRDFPVTPSAYETTYAGSNEAFVTKVSAAGDAIEYATYLGDTNPDIANAIAVDNAGDAYIAGYAYGAGFPVAAPLQMNSGGFYDAIVAELDPAGSGLVFSTYLGGTGDEYANDLALDSSGNLYVAGDTFSADFPTTPAAYTSGYTGGSYDAWAAKISPQNAPGLSAVPNPLVFPAQAVGTTSAPQTVKLLDAGSSALEISSIAAGGGFAATQNCGTVAAGTICPVSVAFTPAGGGFRTGSMTITDNAAGSPQTVQLQGVGISGAVSLSATSLDFGSLPVGTTSPSQTVTLTNPAQSPLDISSLQVQGDFSESNTCGSVVSAGGGCTISVTFSPSSVGTSVGSLTITDSAGDSPQAIVLTGTGTLPFTLTAQQASMNVLQGTDQVDFTVSASSNSGYTGSVALSCVNIAPATCSFNPTTITPGGSSTLSVGNLNAVTSSSFSFFVSGTLVTTSSQLTTSSGTSSTSSNTGTASLPLTVNFENFTLTSSPSQASVSAGASASFKIALTPVNGFALQVNLSCAGAPPKGSCTVSPSSVTLDGSAPADTQLTVITASGSLAGPLPGQWKLPLNLRRWQWFWLCCWGVLLLLYRFERRARSFAVVLTVLFCLWQVSCGGGAGGGGSTSTGPSGTPAGTYTVQIIAKAQTLTNSGKVTVTVN